MLVKQPPGYLGISSHGTDLKCPDYINYSTRTKGNVMIMQHVINNTDSVIFIYSDHHSYKFISHILYSFTP